MHNFILITQKNLDLLHLIIIYMQQQTSTISQTYGCAFCEDSRQGDLLIMMSEAVYTKHAINQSESYISYIDSIMKLQEPSNREEAVASYQHQEYLHLDERDQYLKREYAGQEFQGKINTLTEYYKFHSNIPRVVQSKIERILGKYHDKKREYDYKRIKRLLKEEQGISITSVQESESECSDSAVEKKSRYSTLLNELDQTHQKMEGMSDSNLLKDLCKQIEKVLPSRKRQASFQIKGAFYQDTIFQRYIKQEEAKTREKLRQKQQERKNTIANNLAKRLALNLLSGREGRQKKKEKETPKQSKELKRREKERDGKQVYNTNIKIQIKNALFCTEENFKANFQSQGRYGKSNKKSEIFKKKIMNPLNFLDSRQPSSKFLSQIYKSNGESKRKLSTAGQQRVTTKESINRSQSKDRKKSLTKYTSQGELKKGVSGSNSARKLVYASNDLHSNKAPSRALSATNLKVRSLSNTQTASATTSFNSAPKRKNVYSFEKRPIQLISNYGSSNLKEVRSEMKGKEVKLNEILSRKLTLKIG